MCVICALKLRHIFFNKLKLVSSCLYLKVLYSIYHCLNNKESDFACWEDNTCIERVNLIYVIVHDVLRIHYIRTGSKIGETYKYFCFGEQGKPTVWQRVYKCLYNDSKFPLPQENKLLCYQKVIMQLIQIKAYFMRTWKRLISKSTTGTSFSTYSFLYLRQPYISGQRILCMSILNPDHRPHTTRVR